MNTKITIIATLRLIDGQLSELTETVKELQAHCIKTEPGMLQYDWYVSEQDDTIRVIETYKDSAAVMHHFDNSKLFSEQLGKSRVFESLEVYGEASEALRERVKKINALHFKVVSLFS